MRFLRWTAGRERQNRGWRQRLRQADTIVVIIYSFECDVLRDFKGPNDESDESWGWCDEIFGTKLCWLALTRPKI